MAGFVPERISFAAPVGAARSVLKRAFPDGVPYGKNRAKLEPKTIFNRMKPSVGKGSILGIVENLGELSKSQD